MITCDLPDINYPNQSFMWHIVLSVSAQDRIHSAIIAQQSYPGGSHGISLTNVFN